MARDESDREDLLREATALVERIELAPVRATHAADNVDAAVEADDRIVAGYRRDGSLSLFFGSDPVYQFNAAGELRRAYVGGRLFKALRGRLISLERQRTENEVRLRSRELTESDRAAFVRAMQERLLQLNARIEAGGVEVTGQVPASANVLSRLRRWLATHDGATIASSPRV